MIVNVWLIYKPGEPRVYTVAYQPAQDQLKCFERDGFRIFCAEIDLPVDGVEPFSVTAKEQPRPIRMTLYCPVCNTQHIDGVDAAGVDWRSRPHRTHLCAHCAHKWRPPWHGDIYTIGV